MSSVILRYSVRKQIAKKPVLQLSSFQPCPDHRTSCFFIWLVIKSTLRNCWNWRIRQTWIYEKLGWTGNSFYPNIIILHLFGRTGFGLGTLYSAILLVLLPSVIFQIESYTFVQVQPPATILLLYMSWVAGFTDVYHTPNSFVEMGISLTFFRDWPGFKLWFSPSLSAEQLGL